MGQLETGGGEAEAVQTQAIDWSAFEASNRKWAPEAYVPRAHTPATGEQSAYQLGLQRSRARAATGNVIRRRPGGRPVQPRTSPYLGHLAAGDFRDLNAA